MIDQWVDADGTVRLTGTFVGNRLESVVVPIAFDTPGLEIQGNWSILTADASTRTVQGTWGASGNGPTTMAPGTVLTIFNSTDNDGVYTLESAVFNEGDSSLDMTLVEALVADSGADGGISETGPPGIKLCDLNVGDVVLSLGSAGQSVIVSMFTPTEFETRNPSTSAYLNVVTTAGRGNMPTVHPSPLDSPGVLKLASPDVAGDGTLLAVAGESGGNDANSLTLEVAEATSLWVYVDELSLNPPELTAGTSNLRVLIARAS